MFQILKLCFLSFISVYQRQFNFITSHLSTPYLNSPKEDFPGSLVVKTLRFQCRERRFAPCSQN